MSKLLILLVGFLAAVSSVKGGEDVQSLVEIIRKAGDLFAKCGGDVGQLEAVLKKETALPSALTYTWQYREKDVLGTVLGWLSVDVYSGTKQKSVTGDYSKLALVLGTMINEEKIKGIVPGNLSAQEIKKIPDAVAAWNLVDSRATTRKAIIRGKQKNGQLNEIIINYDSWSDEI